MKNIENIICNLDKKQDDYYDQLNESFLSTLKSGFHKVSHAVGNIAGLLSGKSLDDINQERYEKMKAKLLNVHDKQKSNYERLLAIASEMKLIRDVDGINYAIESASIEDDIDLFLDAYENDKFEGYNKDLADEVFKFLCQGNKKELIKLENPSYINEYAKPDQGVIAYLQDLLKGEIKQSSTKEKGDILRILFILDYFCKKCEDLSSNAQQFLYRQDVVSFFQNKKDNSFNFSDGNFKISELMNRAFAIYNNKNPNDISYISMVSDFIDSDYDTIKKILLSNGILSPHLFSNISYGTLKDFISDKFSLKSINIKNFIEGCVEYIIINIMQSMNFYYNKWLVNKSTDYKDPEIKGQIARLYSHIKSSGSGIDDNDLQHLYKICLLSPKTGSSDTGGGLVNTDLTLNVEKLIKLRKLSTDIETENKQKN